MGKKSWAVTITPLAVYVITFAYSLATGTALSDQHVELLQTLFYGFLGAGAIGAAKAVVPTLK